MNISVVIPLYNKGPHVAAAIDSALEQAFQPCEIIVVDDGSTDGSLDTVRSMQSSLIRIFERSPPGPGGYAARNLGIEKATGEWVAFLDADDRWLPHHLSDLSEAVRQGGTDVGCVFSAFEVKENGRDRPYPLAGSHIRPGRSLDLADVIQGWLATSRCPFWTSASAFRRDLLLDAGLFPAGRARRGGDKDLWLRCAANSRSAFAPRSSAEFHQDGVNRVTKSTKHTELPIIVDTISELMENSTGETRVLLAKLSNLEVEQYARHAAGAGLPIDGRFLKAVRRPGWLPTTMKILGWMALSRAVRLKKSLLPRP